MPDVAIQAVRLVGRNAARALLALSALVLLMAGLGPLTGAYRTVTVLSGSMGPGMPVGAVAVLVPVNPAAVKVGDVITFQAPIADHPVVTHRVVEILEGGAHPVFRTKGDANLSADPWSARIESSPAWRRVAVVPYAGRVIRALRSAPVHHATVQVVPVLLLGVLLLAIWSHGSKEADGARG
jgi:signal peptidase